MNLASLFYYQDILLYISFIPLIGIFLLVFINPEQQKLMKIMAINFSSIPFILFLFIWGGFKKSVGTFQFVSKLLWVPILNLNITLGIDGISLFFLLLTTFLIPLCILISWNSIGSNLKSYLISFLLIEYFLIGVFCVLDVLMFYMLFESILIPMFLVIGIWGSRERKMLASYYFFLYTLLGSVVMLLSILYIYGQVGTTDYEILLTFMFSDFEQKVLWITFFLAFAAKVPMIPVHLWLPEAHVEAPTAGSVILAGVLLKLGTYGFIRFSLPLFPQASFYFAPLVYTMSLIGIIYASLTAIRQTDFKRIIAYTSVAHMNVVMLGIFSFNNVGIEGALLQSLSHGFVASALFVIIGVVYERYRTRLVKYYGGLVHTMPLYISVFLFFTMANIGFPGTSGFIGEFLIFVGSFKVNSSVTVFGATGMILGGCYALWLFNRIAYGNLKSQYIKETLDINKREFFIFVPLIIYTLILGLIPDAYLSSIHMSVNNLIENMYF
uniref:NADH-ubiquinone oxidoreductase chain 4 n=1 Tax=Codium fragile TaxID=3133 RepID=A0A6M3QLW2_CODFR|nr:NADH dehydrogenase subunit 4 [Codium fragile]QJC59766.1 NADH dehydrogenase subunit 4 [Codium fragile]